MYFFYGILKLLLINFLNLLTYQFKIVTFNAIGRLILLLYFYFHHFFIPLFLQWFIFNNIKFLKRSILLLAFLDEFDNIFAARRNFR